MSNFLATMPRRMHCPQLERFTESEKLPSVEVTLGPVRFSLLLGVASVCLPASMAANIGFHPRIDLSTGSSKPVRIAIADFNGDGKLDIAAPDYYGQDLLIYLNKGDGTFGAPIVNTLQISNTLDGLVASDLDKDGKQDLVVGTVSGAQQDDIVLLGNGDGTFRQQPPIPGSFGFFDAKLADFNGDGNLDFITAANVPLYFFAGHGDGSFAAPQTLSSSNGFFSEMAVGDFNGDKQIDFVGVNPGASGISGVGFFAGDGKGGFTEQFYPLQTLLNSPNSIDAADFNGNGKLDIALAAPDVTVIAFGNGDGTFQLAENQLVLGWGHPSHRLSPAMISRSCGRQTWMGTASPTSSLSTTTQARWPLC